MTRWGICVRVVCGTDSSGAALRGNIRDICHKPISLGYEWKLLKVT